MAQKRHFWKEGVNESLRRWGLGVTLPVTKIGLALVFLGSEICVVKKVPKKAIFRTLRCRQLGRRGLNRKTKSTSRFFGPNYPPVQNFSEKNDKKFLGTISVFFAPLKELGFGISIHSVTDFSTNPTCPCLTLVVARRE